MPIEISSIADNNLRLIDDYIASLDVSIRSKDTYRKSVRQFLRWLTANGITQPARSDILRYKAELLAKYSACTVSSYITGVKSFFTYLESAKISPNIAAGIKGAKHQQGFRKDALTAAQATELLRSIDRASIEGKRNYALINLLIRTGLRTVEATRALVSDIRHETGEALLYIQGKGRDSKDAFVVLTLSTLRPIEEYLTARGRLDGSAPLFASHSDRNSGQALTTRTISRIVKDALLSAGLYSSRLSAHSLRHTAVTLSLLGGASIQEAQLLARHQNINTTLIYAHNLERIAKAPEYKIDSLLEQAL